MTLVLYLLLFFVSTLTFLKLLYMAKKKRPKIHPADTTHTGYRLTILCIVHYTIYIVQFMVHLVFLEGIIGAGKSSLLHCLQQEHGFTVLPESVDTAGTFRDAVIHGVPFQLNIAAMLDLLRRLRRAIAQAPSTELTRTVVLERGLLGSTAFVELAAANNTMTALEVGLCKELLREIHVVIDQAVSDGIVEKVTTVYLRIQTDTALARVRLRKRSGEEWISAAYLQALQAQHDALMRRNDANPPHRRTLVTTVADIETESASALAAQLAKTLRKWRVLNALLHLLH